MLTIKQNLLETIKGGNPDRFVNQYEYLGFINGGNPYAVRNLRPDMGAPDRVNAWGVTYSFPVGTPGPFPVHKPDTILCKDITKWRDYIKAPKLDYPDSEWLEYKHFADEIDTNEVFSTYFIAPGIFEQLHNFQGVDGALINLYEEPEYTQEIIDFLVDWELEYAEKLCKFYHPEAIFHHDDWGSYRSSFMSPEMFKEFLVPAYKKIYGYYKEHGVQLIVHHSDSYAANLVEDMIDIGIDIWQGAASTNNNPELIKKYGSKISIMGDLDNSVLDKGDITREEIAQIVRHSCESCGTKYFIPCLIRGLSGSTYPGVYEAVSEEIDKMSKEMFK